MCFVSLTFLSLPLFSLSLSLLSSPLCFNQSFSTKDDFTSQRTLGVSGGIADSQSWEEDSASVHHSHNPRGLLIPTGFTACAPCKDRPTQQRSFSHRAEGSKGRRVGHSATPVTFTFASV